MKVNIMVNENQVTFAIGMLIIELEGAIEMIEDGQYEEAGEELQSQTGTIETIISQLEELK